MNQADRKFGVAAEFDTPAALLDAIRGARAKGYKKMDAYTPFPVHGLDRALSLERSKLGYLVFWIGLLGTVSALLLQWWTGAVDYPLVIGGKPFFSFEFSIPITFELTVLFAAFAAVIGMLVFNGLPRLNHPVFSAELYGRVSDDHFLLVIEGDDPQFDAGVCQELLVSLGAQRTELIGEVQQ